MSKNSSCFLLLIILSLLSINCFATSDDSAWEKIRADFFAGAIIHENTSDNLFIQVPKKVEDAAIVPIKITSLMPQSKQHYIKKLYLFIDNNPVPLAAIFHLSPTVATSGSINLATRIRIDSYSTVRVIAEMNDGALHMNSRFVIAAGGCSAPPLNRDGSSVSGKRIKTRLNEASTDQAINVRILIKHPNASGLQFNPITGQYIPAHYVTDITISFENKVLMKIETGISVSENPSFNFSFSPEKQGILSIKVMDSKKQAFSEKLKIEQPAS